MSQEHNSAIFGGLQWTLLDGVTATGQGSSFDLRNVYYHHSFEVTWGGTVPDAVYITIDGSIVGSDYHAIGEENIKIDESPYTFEILEGTRFLKADYGSKDGGDTDTSITIRSVSGGS